MVITQIKNYVPGLPALLLYVLAITVLLPSCSISWHKGPSVTYKKVPYNPEHIRQQVQDIERQNQSFAGFALYDPASDKMLVEYNADKYFMPASNTKLFTFYTSQRLIGDSIPALRYAVRGDSLFFWDPSEVALARKHIRRTEAFRFLNNRPEKLFCINAPLSSLSSAIDWGWDSFMVQALADTLKRPVRLLTREIPRNGKILYGLPADTVYKRMLQVDDNLLAEQLLVLSSGALSDTLSAERAIRHMLDTDLADLPDKPVWVDGSGISTLNMLTPRTMVALLQKLLEIRPQEELFPLLPNNGHTRTGASAITPATPFIHGEAATLAHIHNQSGYIVTRSGKILLYSFMNNNLKDSSSEIQDTVMQIMREVYEKY